jgi:hypothetical protein
MDKQLNSNQYIQPDEWGKIPKGLQKRIRAKEHSLGGGNLKKGAVKEDKQLTKLYIQARKYADWSFMNSN